MTDDPRAVRSRARLQQGLRLLLDREELTSIGVAELCRVSGVHRTTFYGHYRHIGDVAADMYATWFDGSSTVLPSADDTAEEAARLYAAAMTAVLEVIRPERATLRTLVESEYALSFIRRLHALFEERVRRAYAAFHAQDAGAPLVSDLAVAYVASGLVGATTHWIESDDDDAEAFTAVLAAELPPWWPRTSG